MDAEHQAGLEEESEDVGAIDPKRGQIPTQASEVEEDSRDLGADKKQADETGGEKSGDGF
ncbi:MAG: hypothetical protein JO025_03515 [Verrucomicrobia bacterium]|nr:hypothetical protein [Verrucomicrobiota bacterium]